MSWEDKFSSIVRETESNLARVRNRLGSSRARTSRVKYTSPNRGRNRLVILGRHCQAATRVLESLSMTVKRLEKERNTQAEMITSLQTQVVKLNDRLREQGGWI
ncbi:hypothetical protein QZH41_013344 [Actinostola sp. cb2023]|nr:hypothetical protein QZH41_013344 [Actinostola sp. cb2023]